VVLASGTPLTIVPLDVTCQVQIRPADIARVRAAGDAYHQVVADQVERYLSHAGRECTNLTDPLAVTSLLDPSLMHLELLHAVVETVGEHSAGKLLVHLPCEDMPATARVALDVDAARAERFIIDRLVK
jgi:inosine-uridine nucleoside N-ribohydrolase